jgi:hypothetical protein
MVNHRLRRLSFPMSRCPLRYFNPQTTKYWNVKYKLIIATARTIFRVAWHDDCFYFSDRASVLDVCSFSKKNYFFLQNHLTRFFIPDMMNPMNFGERPKPAGFMGTHSLTPPSSLRPDAKASRSFYVKRLSPPPPPRR